MKNIDKPEKIYLANTNLMYITTPDIGNVRETFFVNQMGKYYLQQNRLNNKGIYVSTKGDFYLEERYICEVGGKSKSFKQIKDIENSFIADDIELGFGKKIPLWLFGFCTEFGGKAREEGEQKLENIAPNTLSLLKIS